MTVVLSQALRAITDRVNLSTGLMLPEHREIAKEMLVLLRLAGEPLSPHEIEFWAMRNGWIDEDAQSLGSLAKLVNAGKLLTLNTGRWWPKNAVSQLQVSLTNQSGPCDPHVD